MPRIVFLSLKTTGFEDPDIIQIAVSKWRSNNARTWYIKPQKTISKNVTRDTGFSVKNGKLCFEGVEKKTLTLKDALQQFVNFLKNCRDKIILAAHNVHFHARLLIRDLKKFGYLDEFSGDVVASFCDTLKLMRGSFPSRVEKNLKFTLPALAEDFLNIELSSHRTADQDVIYLSSILRRAGTPAWVILDNKLDTNVRVDEIECRMSLMDSPLNGFLSKNMIKKMANLGIVWETLVEMYELGRDIAVEGYMNMNNEFDQKTMNDVNWMLMNDYYTN